LNYSRPFDILRDYRSLSVDEKRTYSPKFLLIIRTAIEHQQWTRNFFIGEGASPLSFVGRSSLEDSPSEIANNILLTLGITPDEQCSCRTRDDALRLWIRKSERSGVFLFRTLLFHIS